ncbi:thioesterase II family protein [Tenacibaculum sp. TC6]|uniref:thioesterase II family protein n=1 Tax=Tenacibaculum sp. TC6 TaxID=3423223 RepID=UPI003D36EAF6
MKLICLTYAGGNKYSYRDLAPYLDKDIEMITLELPGRGSRIGEPLIDNLDQLVIDLYNQIQDDLNDNYMIFGHSMGAMLGNLLIHKLKNNNNKLPVCFLATGCSSPKKRGLKTKIHQLSKAAFQQEILNLGGMPDEVVKSQDLLDFILPVLRSDIKAIETKIYEENEKYNVPVISICGSDENIKEDDIIDWKDETSASFSYHFLSGGHFFILDHKSVIADIINTELLKRKKEVTI